MYSLFTKTCTFTPRKRSILLQFLIDALEHNDLKQIEDLVSLLPFAFPKVPALKNAKRKNIEFLVPFLEECKNDEGLILFLLRRGKIHLLKRVSFKTMKKKFQERGFHPLADEIEALIKN
jgi:hypothetical protein